MKLDSKCKKVKLGFNVQRYVPVCGDGFSLLLLKIADIVLILKFEKNAFLAKHLWILAFERSFFFYKGFQGIYYYLE